jgi:hypothetical protein
MKKALGGCLVAAVVLLVLGGAALWFLVLKPAAQVAGTAIDGARESIAQVTDLGRTVLRMRELESAVRTATFAAPADGRLAPAQVERFLAVQQAVQSALGPAFGAATAAVDTTAPVAEQASAAFESLARLGDVGMAAKQAQVDALNAQAMSLDEYRWIRERAIEALVAGGVSVALAGAGAAGGEVLGQAGETAQQIGDAARQASEAAAAAADAARRAARAARDAWRGEQPSAPAPQPAPATPEAPVAGSGVPAPDAAAGAPGDDPRAADFALVEPHAEAFIRAKALAAIGL